MTDGGRGGEGGRAEASASAPDVAPDVAPSRAPSGAPSRAPDGGTLDRAAPKEAWRLWARAQRAAWAADAVRRSADEAAVRAALAAWAPWRQARLALAYVAFGDELDPLPVGTPALATTRTLGRGRPLALHAWTEPLERHRFGFLQPRADARRVDPSEIDLVLVPGLAFDRRGARLGYGQGHYDRLLPTLGRSVPTVGVAIEALVVERLPSSSHDAPVGWLLTPSGVRAVDGAGG